MRAVFFDDFTYSVAICRSTALGVVLAACDLVFKSCASRRGKHYFLKGGAGEEDKEFVVVKDEADAYVYRAIMVAQEA